MPFWGVSWLLRTAFVGLCAGLAGAQTSPLVSILSEELDRNFQVLKQKADPAPYFMGYEVTEQEGRAVSATLGALRSNSADRNRTLDVTVRVGSPKLDNWL